MLYQTSSYQYRKHLSKNMNNKSETFGEFMLKHFRHVREPTMEHVKMFLGPVHANFLQSPFITNGLHRKLEMLDLKGDVQGIRDFVKKHDCLEDAKKHVNFLSFKMKAARIALGMPSKK